VAIFGAKDGIEIPRGCAVEQCIYIITSLAVCNGLAVADYSCPLVV